MDRFDDAESGIDAEPAEGFGRRTLVKGAAWSMPVVALAVSAPLASASVDNAALLSWAPNSTLNGTNLFLLDSSTPIISDVAPVSFPPQFMLTNGPGAISATATITITVAPPLERTTSGLSGRGFGVYSYNGIVTAPETRTLSYQQVNAVDIGLPTTSFTTSQMVTVESNGSFVVPVIFGLAGTRVGGVTTLVSNFPVSLTLDFGDGHSYSAATTNISVSAGSSIL